MMSCFNGCVRSERDWNRLLHEADSGFKMEGVRRVDGSAVSLVEVTWAGN